MFSGGKLAVSDATFFKHPDGSFDGDAEAAVIKIVQIDDFFDAGLDDGFGAFDTGEVMHVNAGALELAHVTAEV